MQESSMSMKSEKPKIPGPKPVIASKPKYVPPVNLKCQKVLQEVASLPPRRKNANEFAIHKQPLEETSTFYTKGQSNFEYRVCKKQNEMYTSEALQSYTTGQKMNYPSRGDSFRDNSSLERDQPYSDKAKGNEKCDKFNNSSHTTSSDNHQKSSDNGQILKAPNSPSTVCCSILSNVGNDCCGIIVNPNKKELDGKGMTKMESVDSNSSDSGGFKEFIQRDMLAAQNEHKTQHHQRKASQPELFENSGVRDQIMSKSYTHQRQASQPEEVVRPSFAQNRQNFVASAQALEQFLPQMCPPKSALSLDRTDDANLRYLPKLNMPHGSMMEKSEELRGGSQLIKPTKAPLIPHSQFQNTTKKLEEFLAQRLEREKGGRKGCVLDGESSQDVEQKMMLQKQIQQKLQADLQRTVKQIQEIQSIELRLPQNRKWTEVCSRSFPIA